MTQKDWSKKYLRALVLPAGKSKRSLADPSTKNLYFELRAKSRSFVYRARRNGQNICRTIGPFPEVSIDEARRAARQLGRENFEALPKKQRAAATTLDQFFEEYFVGFTRQRHKDYRANVGLYRNHIASHLGSKRLADLTKADVRNWSQSLVRRRLKNSTINRISVLLGQILKLAEEYEVEGSAGCSRLCPKTLPVKPTHDVYLSPDDVRRLKDALASSLNPDLPHIVQLLLLTGARKNEVLRMRWEHVDPNFQFWVVPISKNGRPRQIQLTETARGLLQARSESRLGSPYVFPNADTGEPYRCIQHSWEKARNKAGLPKLRIHDLRHSFASALVNHGVPLYEVQHLLGHSSIKTTQRYAHLSTERLSGSAAHIEDIYARPWRSSECH